MPAPAPVTSYHQKSMPLGHKKMEDVNDGIKPFSCVLAFLALFWTFGVVAVNSLKQLVVVFSARLLLLKKVLGLSFSDTPINIQDHEK